MFFITPCSYCFAVLPITDGTNNILYINNPNSGDNFGPFYICERCYDTCCDMVCSSGRCDVLVNNWKRVVLSVQDHPVLTTFQAENIVQYIRKLSITLLHRRVMMKELLETRTSNRQRRFRRIFQPVRENSGYESEVDTVPAERDCTSESSD